MNSMPIEVFLSHMSSRSDMLDSIDKASLLRKIKQESSNYTPTKVCGKTKLFEINDLQAMFNRVAPSCMTSTHPQATSSVSDETSWGPQKIVKRVLVTLRALMAP